MCSAARGVSLLVTGIRSVRCDERSGQMHVNGSRMNMRSMWAVAKWGLCAHNVFPCDVPRWTCANKQSCIPQVGIGQLGSEPARMIDTDDPSKQ